jgi:hypothetical protein
MMSFFSRAWNQFQTWISWHLVFFGLSLCFSFLIKTKLKGGKMQTNIGPETVLLASAENGQLKLATDYKGVDVNAGAYISATPDQLCAALAKLIPGDSAAEHAALAVVKGALDLAGQSSVMAIDWNSVIKDAESDLARVLTSRLVGGIVAKFAWVGAFSGPLGFFLGLFIGQAVKYGDWLGYHLGNGWLNTVEGQKYQAAGEKLNSLPPSATKEEIDAAKKEKSDRFDVLMGAA